jgi:hypothetical protein
MKNNLISESEVKEILSMHKLLKEQTEMKKVTDTSSDLVMLRKAITAGCLKGGRILTNANQTKYVYRATSKSGKTVDFTADMNYKFGDGSKSGKWKCDEIAQMEVTAAQAAQQQAANTEDINRMKKEGGWKEESELKTTRENLNNPQMFEKKVVNGVTLYRDVISSGVTGGLTPEQIKVVKKYTDLGGKLRTDLDAEEAQTWTSKVVYPAGTLFSQDLVMYFDPNNVVGSNRGIVDKDSPIGSRIEDEFNKAKKSQTPTSKRDCRDTIESYYEAWRTKKRFQPNILLPMKEKVQACANEFEGKWGGVLSRIDNYVEILRGDREGGPLSDSKWRIE